MYKYYFTTDKRRGSLSFKDKGGYRMKILLINSSFGKRYDSRKTVTLAMYYLGAILRDKGHTIHIINPDDYIDGMVGESLASVIIEKFKDFDLFAFSSNTFTWGYVKKCISTLKVNNIKNPIVVGGIHPSRVFNHIMQTTDIDYILIGEGDKSFPILVETLERKKNLSEVPNLVCAHHGGGAFSGKDCTKVDRSAAYMARYLAKNIVALGLAEKCEVQLSYAIGIANPVSVNVNTFGTGKKDDELLAEFIYNNFDLTPSGIIDIFKLRRPIYEQVASYGHFGRTELNLPWEQLDTKKFLGILEV